MNVGDEILAYLLDISCPNNYAIFVFELTLIPKIIVIVVQARQARLYNPRVFCLHHLGDLEPSK